MKILKDKLFVIGNGFDLWQGYSTSYAAFKRYFDENEDKLLHRLHIKKHRSIDNDGSVSEFTDADLIYGNTCIPEKLGENFWSKFEDSLAEIDDVSVNYYFGKEKSDLKELLSSARGAKKIFTAAFVQWIRSIDIQKKEIIKNLYFDDSCIFVNFNYTDTLQKQFGVSERDIWFIHGNANEKRSIIFGHSRHPDPPNPILKRFGGRFKGLFYLESLLFETDKQVEENIIVLTLFFASHGIRNTQIKDVYVLGHSFGDADFGYFRFLADATRENAVWHITCYCDEDREKVSRVMKKLHFKNYKIYAGIDECLAKSKV